MQNLNKVNTLVFKNSISVGLDKNAFTFRADKKFHSVQRLCIWILNKLECHHRYSRDESGFIKYDPATILENLNKQLTNYGRAGMNSYHLDKIFMGPEAFKEFGGELKGLKMGRPLSTLLAVPDGPPPSFMGIPIQVIPWMEGVLITKKTDQIDF